MSTLGGSKGERHAKPTKFAALDINRLYSSSRGESLEPSTQKNAVPRKHGMQSLGKVPSARRPPANLPSLKAETSTPTDPSWGPESTQSQGTTATTTTTTAVGAAATTNSGSNSVSAPSSNTLAVSSPNSVTSLNSNSISSTLVSSSNQSNTSSASSSTTWSSVATGAPVEIAQPPLYQSPQFQHEFPSLDGSVPVLSKGNRNDRADSHPLNSDGQHMSLRPQTDAASWMQQQQQGGAGNRENGNSQVSQQDQALQQVPPQFRALMPPFMYRSGNGAGLGGMAQPPNQFGLPQTAGSGTNYPPPPIQVKQRPQQGSGSHQSYNDEYNSSYRRDERPMQQRRGPPHSNRPQNNRHDGGYGEHQHQHQQPDEPVVPRPIIKEEELNRMDSLAKGDGWSKCDEIDYNQKLVFSDDDDVPVKESKNDKKGNANNRDAQRHEEDNRAVWNREREREKNEREREREKNEREREREKNEREREREREKNERNERERAGADKVEINSRIQQNGHRGGLDAEVVERVKLRKEEEEKLAYERKQAASKKLQELEQKINKKKELDENHVEPAAKSELSDFRAMTQIVGGDSGNRFGNRDMDRPRMDRDKDNRGGDRDRDGRDRDYGRYDNKYERDINSRERDGAYKDGYGHRGDRGGNERDNAASSFSRPFQSNLPPRFQKQHQQDRDPRGGFSGSSGTSSAASSNYPFNRNNSSSNNYSNDQKNVPFGQQPYETRYNTHSQNNSYKQQQLGQSSQMRRHPSDEMMSGRRNERKRIDSEEEDRFSRDSTSRNSLGDKPPPLNRSISDSSQRKTSVSSEDKPMDSSFRSDRSDSKELNMSWADDLESEMNRLENRSTSPQVNKSNASLDNQPKHILQRQPKVSESSRDEKEKSEERDLKSSASEKESSPPISNRITESPPKVWADCVPDSIDGNKIDKSNENLSAHSTTQKSGSEEKKAENLVKSNTTSSGKDDEGSKHSVTRTYSSGGKDVHSSDDGKHGSKPRTSSRGGNRGGSTSLRSDGNVRNDGRDSRGGYNNSYKGQSWGNRRGGGRQNRYNDYYSESDGSDDGNEHRSDRNYKGQRKDVNSGGVRHVSSRGGSMSQSQQQQQQKEGFVPRGEPSRLGRGGMTAAAPFRRGGASVAPKRIVIGPPSSKSPFGESDEKLESKKDAKSDAVSVDDKTKLSQMALSAGLSGKKSPSGGGHKKDESYESTSEMSDTQDGKNKNRSVGAKLTMSSSSGSIVSNKNIPRDEKKTSPKPSFGGPQRKDGLTGTKTESQPMKKDDEKFKTSNENVDKKGPVKKDEVSQAQGHNQQRNSNVQASNNRNKPRDDRQNVQQMKPSAKPMPGVATKPAGPTSSTQSQSSQQAVQPGAKPIQDRGGRINHTVSKLAPRFVKQRQQRTDQINGNQMQNAWDKPLSSTLGSSDTENMSHGIDDGDINNVHGDASLQRNTARQTTNAAIGEKSDLSINLKTDNSKQHLDGTSPPVNTIIFENTNYKTIPSIKRQSLPPQQQQQQTVQQLDKKPEDVFKNTSSGTFQDMLDAQQQQQQQIPRSGTQQQSESISSALQTMSFPKSDAEYEKDMKLAFTFESEISQLTDDKTATSKGLGITRSGMHSVSNTAPNSIISPSTAELNMKIASVKKVWENVIPMPTVLEHTVPDDSHLQSNFTSQHQQHMHQFTHGPVTMTHVQHALSPAPGSYSATFGPDPGSLEQHFVKASQEEVESGYSPSPQHVGQGHHQNMKHGGDPLSTNTNVCKVKPTQQQLHQSGLGLSPPPMQQGGIQTAYYPSPSQFGSISAIPSPPAVMYNSTQMQSQGNVYGHFSMDTSRSQFSQFPPHFGAAGSAPYNYMQTPPAPTPDMYQNISSQFRMGAAVQAPFNQSQQLNSPSTVLISSTSNSLMSASVKPSSQQIGAIGSKTGTVGQQYAQQYMNLYTQPAPPLQSNSYYSNSAAGQGGPFFGPATGTQAYGLPTAGMFGGHAPAPTTAPPQQQVPNYNSPFLNSQLLAINRQYPTGPTQPNANPPYIKSNQQQQQQSHAQDPSGRQLKSPLNSDGGLNLKQPPSQQSPPHHKNYVASWDMQQLQQQQQQQQQQQHQNRSGSQNNMPGRPGPGPQRYPTPIQRPTNYPQHQQQTQQQQQQNQQRPIRQPHSGQVNSGPMNKHYYPGGGRGGHITGGTEQAITGKSSSDKSLENSSTAQDASKEDGQND